MKWLYAAHIPFIVLFVLFVAGLAWRGGRGRG